MFNIYVTSSKKHEGKTLIAAGISATMHSLGYSTAVYKPIQTSGIEIKGFMQSPDLTYIKTVDAYIETAFSYLFKSNSVPLIAAETENEIINPELILINLLFHLINSLCYEKGILFNWSYFCINFLF